MSDIDNLHFDAHDKLFQFGRELRKRSTPAERKLWSYLRNRKMDGLKFRRQHPLGSFIADFYCHEKKIVIECDGEVHDGRFRNDVILNEIEIVLKEIRKTISSLST